MKTDNNINQENENSQKNKKGTFSYMVLQTFLMAVSMFLIYQLFNSDIAIMVGIVLLSSMVSVIRYNLKNDKKWKA